MPVSQPILLKTATIASVAALPAPAPEPAARAVDVVGAGLDGRNGAADAQAEVVVSVETDVGLRLEFRTQRRDAVVHHIHGLRAG